MDADRGCQIPLFDGGKAAGTSVDHGGWWMTFIAGFLHGLT